MTCITFTVCEKSGGWFVTGHDDIGPFICKEKAMDLALGMAAAIQDAGQDAEVVVAPTSAPARWMLAGSRERPFTMRA